MPTRRCPHCLHQTDTLFVRCPYKKCELLSHVTVLLTGPVLSMKSVTAYYLHRYLQMGIVESAYYGGVKPEGKTEPRRAARRRERVYRSAMIFAGANLAVIVDAAFHHRNDRLDFVKKHNLRSKNTIICLYCHSRDPVRRRHRLDDRNYSKERLEMESSTWEDAQERLAAYEPPDKREPYPIVNFDTDSFTVRIQNLSGQTTEIKKFIDELRVAIERGVAIGRI